MSAFLDLANALIVMAEADTGAGGLYNASAPLVTGVFTLVAPEGQLSPYVVIEPISEDEEKVFATANYGVEFLIQFSIYAEKQYSGQSLAIVSLISDRIRAVYDRQSPSVSGWTSSQLLRLGSSPPPQIVDGAVYQADQYQAYIAK